MNGLADPFRQLMERKLWPIAAVLVAALVAVPFLLKKDPEPVVLPPATTASVTAADSTDAIVSLSDAGKRDEARTVLGERKDPFRPAQLHRVKKAEDVLAGSASDGSQTSSSDTSGGGTEAPSSGADEDPTVPVPEAPAQTYDLYSLQVRFGSTETDSLVTRNVKRLTGLPGGQHPAALYLGLSEDRKSAVFIIDAGVTVLGDGKCDPDPENCQTLLLKPGETVFLTRGDKQWELDLVKIYTKKTTDEQEAIQARKSIAAGGRAALRKQLSRIGRYRYDEDEGVLKKVSPEEQAKRELESATAKFTTSD